MCSRAWPQIGGCWSTESMESIRRYVSRYIIVSGANGRRRGGMTEKDVVRVLKFYKTIPDEIWIRQDRIAELEDRYNALGSVSLDGMPRSGHVCDQTGNAVVRIEAAGQSALADIAIQEQEIEALKNLERYIFNCVKQLPYFQKMVIYRLFFDGWSLTKIAHSLHYSERQCRRIKSVALKTLTPALERCPFMSGFPM